MLQEIGAGDEGRTRKGMNRGRGTPVAPKATAFSSFATPALRKKERAFFTRLEPRKERPCLSVALEYNETRNLPFLARC
jgi:hypothetical protein